VSPVAACSVNQAATDAGKVANVAASRKAEKYLSLSSTYIFSLIAVENLGVFSCTTLNFIFEVGCKIHIQSTDVCEGSFTSLLPFSASIQCFCTTF